MRLRSSTLDFVKNLTLFFVSLIVTFAVCEVVVRMFVTVRNVGPDYTTYDSIYGKRLKKSFSALRITPEFTMRLTTNSSGFRGPEQDTFSYRPILFLGDSFTEGYGVNDGEEFPKLVSKALDLRYGNNKVPVVNAGVEDTGNGHWIKFLRNEGSRYSPRLVVLQLMANDFRDNISERLFDLRPNGELVELPVPPSSIRRILRNMVVELFPALEYSYLIGFVGESVAELSRKWMISKLKHNKKLKRASRHSEQLTYRLIEEALRICEKEGWPVFVLMVSIGGERFYEFKRMFEDHEVSFVRIPDAIQRPDYYYSVDGHWNAAGHAYVADLILERMPGLDICLDVK